MHGMSRNKQSETDNKKKGRPFCLYGRAVVLFLMVGKDGAWLVIPLYGKPSLSIVTTQSGQALPLPRQSNKIIHGPDSLFMFFNLFPTKIHTFPLFSDSFSVHLPRPYGCKGRHIGKERLRYYPALESGQFQSSRIVDKSAHVSVIYLPILGVVYIEVWRGLLFIT